MTKWRSGNASSWRVSVNSSFQLGGPASKAGPFHRQLARDLRMKRRFAIAVEVSSLVEVSQTIEIPIEGVEVEKRGKRFAGGITEPLCFVAVVSSERFDVSDEAGEIVVFSCHRYTVPHFSDFVKSAGVPAPPRRGWTTFRSW